MFLSCLPERAHSGLKHPAELLGDAGIENVKDSVSEPNREFLFGPDTSQAKKRCLMAISGIMSVCVPLPNEQILRPEDLISRTFLPWT